MLKTVLLLDIFVETAPPTPTPTPPELFDK